MLSVSRNAYYHWLQSRPGKWAQENAELLKEIRLIHALSGQTYGSPGITQELHKRGYSCSRARRGTSDVKEGDLCENKKEIQGDNSIET